MRLLSLAVISFHFGPDSAETDGCYAEPGGEVFERKPLQQVRTFFKKPGVSFRGCGAEEWNQPLLRLQELPFGKSPSPVGYLDVFFEKLLQGVPFETVQVGVLHELDGFVAGKIVRIAFQGKYGVPFLAEPESDLLAVGRDESPCKSAPYEIKVS